MALPESPAPVIPLIDFSISDEELVMRAVVKASEEWGIFQVVNHGVPTELIQQLQAVGKQFLDLPEVEKEAVARSGGMEGYVRKYSPYINALSENLYHRLWPQSCVDYKYWPKSPPQYKEVTEEYTRHMMKLGEKIMGWLSKGLGLRSEALKEHLGGEEARYAIKINCYRPDPCKRSELSLGVEAHTDVHAFSLLIPNEVPGLQAFKDEQWFNLEYINNAVVVFIGDTFMRMSNGTYRNVLHRVTMDKENTRISWPVFVLPTPDAMVGPLPQLTGDENPPKFETVVYNDYMTERDGEFDIVRTRGEKYGIYSIRAGNYPKQGYRF